MLKLIREIAGDSVQVARMTFKNFRGGSESAQKLREAQQILQDAKDKAKEEEAILLDIRARALKELAAMQTKALKVGAIQAGEVDNEHAHKGLESPTQKKK